MKKFGIILVLLVTVMLAVNTFAQISPNNAGDKHAIMSSMSSLALAFAENRGQWRDKTLFKAEANGVTFYFCKDEVLNLPPLSRPIFGGIKVELKSNQLKFTLISLQGRS